MKNSRNTLSSSSSSPPTPPTAAAMTMTTSSSTSAAELKAVASSRCCSENRQLKTIILALVAVSMSTITASPFSIQLVKADDTVTDGDCCNSQKTTGCNNIQCQEFICSNDPFCCNKSWDWLCAANANEACQVCQETSVAQGQRPTPRPLQPPPPKPSNPPQPVQVLSPVASPTTGPFFLSPSSSSSSSTAGAAPAVAASQSRRIVSPQCDPKSPSYAPTTDKTSSCFQTIELCDRDGTIDPAFYPYTDVMMTDCFDTCANYLDSIDYQNGVDIFCTLMDLPPEESQIPEPSFCDVVDDAWDGRQDLVDHEQQMLLILNNKYRSMGITCPDGTVYDKVSNAIINPRLQCAARMQAFKIVQYLNKYKPGGPYSGFPQEMPSLHVVCVGDGWDTCDQFWERIDKAGYQRYGSAYENAGAGYKTPEAMMAGWKTSTSGHCPVLMTQEWTAVQSEVGLAYYEDLQTGWSAHIMVLGAQ